MSGAAVLITATRGQNFGDIKGLKLAEPYGPPHETQMKSLLEAAKARRLPEGQYLCTDAILQTFAETGQRELIVRAPECVADPVSHGANSAGPLKVQTGDGQFTLEGEGFLWQQTNSTLFVSNHVHTILHQGMLEPGSVRPPADATAKAAQNVEIFSQRFVYSKLAGLGVYTGNVQVYGTNFGLTAEQMTVELPMNERRLQSIVAEQNVVVDYTNVSTLQATAEHAIYDALSGLIHLTGHPTWRADRREGRGDELVMDRSNRIFQANGNAWLKMPAERKGAFGFLSMSNAPAGTATATNQFVEVQSDRYEFRTNTADFWEHVLLKQWAGEELRGKMSCVQMRATFSNSNELQNLVAHTNVVIEGADKRLTGGQAVYTSTNGWLELTQKPTWKAGDRQGKGDRLRMNTQQEEMQALGHAYLRMPAQELGQTMALGGPTTLKKPPLKSAAPQFGEIFSEDYTLTPALSVFRGGVHAKHPQMDWVCDRLTIRSLPGDGKVVFGDKAVSFTLIDDKGQKMEGNGDHIIYTNNVTSTLTNDIIYLRGNPATLEVTNTIISNTNIIYDRVTDTLSAPGGAYKITGTAKASAGTNMFKLPKNKNKP